MKNIPLDKGMIAIIDDEDYDQLIKMGRWFAGKHGGFYYASINTISKQGEKHQLLMHRIIAKPPKGLVIKHSNGNTLDNRKDNLIIVPKFNKREHRYQRNPSNNNIIINKMMATKNSLLRNKIALCLKVWRIVKNIKKCKILLKNKYNVSLSNPQIEIALKRSKAYALVHNKFYRKFSWKDNIYANQWAKKIKAIYLLGSECAECGNKNIFHLDFHHIDKKTKEQSVSYLFTERRPWNVIKKEIKKCILLCGNCHAKLHNPTNTKESKIELLRIKGTTTCQRCGYDAKSFSTLDFHHTRDKIFSMSTVKRISDFRNNEKLSKIKLELSKCLVLCKNCHMEEHMNTGKVKRLMELIKYRSHQLEMLHEK